jgi:tRNA pseudouridine55 synthase
MKLGETSTTADDEGEKTAVSDTVPTEKAVLEALQQLQGPIMQVPPQFSAMKINGQRAYKLARKGEIVELEGRPVTIYSNELTGYEYPYVKFTSRVSSGTYIRSLVEDLGKLLETGAYMSDLRRTSVGAYSLEAAVVVSGLTVDDIERLLTIIK